MYVSHQVSNPTKKYKGSPHTYEYLPMAKSRQKPQAEPLRQKKGSEN